jgi:hypothetical protein
MWKNIAERDRPQMTIWRMRIACWIPKTKNTNSKYVRLTAFSTATMVAQKRLKFSRQHLKNTQIPNFLKIHPVRGELFHAEDGQT